MRWIAPAGTALSASVRHVLPMSPQEIPIGRRIRAARALAGIASVAELAKVVDTRNLGERTLRKLEDDNDSRDAQRYEIRAIADATGLPIGFFTTPAAQWPALFAEADETIVDQTATAGLDDLRHQVADLVEAITALSSGDAETALRAARSAAERAPRETAQDAPSRRRRLAPAPGADREAR